MTRKIPALYVAPFLVLGSAAASALVTVTTQFAASASGLTTIERDAIDAHVRAATLAWTNELRLAGPRALEIEIGIDESVPTGNGTSLTTAFVGTVGARNLFEQGVAAELRTGTDPNSTAPDARFNFSTNYLRNELWFDPDPVARTAPVPVDRTDAMSVFLHEFGHAIAYNGWANGAGVPPPDYFSTFDRWMIAGTPTTFNGPVALAVRGSAPDLTTNNIHHWGNSMLRKAAPWTPLDVMPLLPGTAPVPHPACGAPASRDAPPSRDAALRVDATGKGATSLIDELMNGVVFYRGSRYRISALDLAVLEDLALELDDGGIFDNGFESP